MSFYHLFKVFRSDSHSGEEKKRRWRKWDVLDEPRKQEIQLVESGKPFKSFI